MYPGKFTSPPIPLNLGSNKDGFLRADIEVYGMDQSGASFEGRVFLNNPDANLSTPLSPEHGYAGSFHVYGYGIWPVDVTENPAKPAASQAIRAPITKTVIATEAVRRAAAKGKEARVTVVPVFPGNPLRDARDAFKLEGVRIIVH
jgi:tyrosinase